VLSWRINKKISLPLIFVDLDKEGNSNTAERLDLLENFDELFGFGRINSLMADREFVGIKWFKTLNKNGIPYFIRVKQNTLLPWGDQPIQASQLFNHLSGYQSRLIEKEMYGSAVFFAGTRSLSGELVIVMSNQSFTAAQILARYLKRWSIEELFRKLKTSGFQWENTHMTKSARLVTLLIVLAFGLLMASLVGYGQPIPWKKTLGYPLYSVFKQGLITLQFLLAQSLSIATQTIQSALQRLQNLNF
jgi:transposase